MAAILRRATTAYSCDQMYALVSDVAAYQNFLPWCDGSSIEGEDRGRTRATLHLKHKGVGLSLTTLNRNVPPSSIEMELAAGPFKHLRGKWTFASLESGGCTVELRMDFDFSNRVYAGLLKPVFERAASSLVKAFTERAGEVYGRT